MKTSPLGRALITLAGFVLSLSTAHAHPFDPVRLQRTAPGQDLAAAGLVVWSGQGYAGADEGRERALPLLDDQWANGWFAGVSNGVGINFSSSPELQYGVRVTADFGRKERRSTALRGMGDIDAKVEGGVFFNVSLAGDWQATTSLRYGSGEGGRGLLADVGVLYGTVLTPHWQVDASAGLSAVNADLMQTYFVVEADQAVHGGDTVYAPGSGWRDARVGASLTYALDPRNALMAAVDFNRLRGDAADGPLTRRRDVASAVFV